MNFSARINPLLRLALSRAAVIFARTAETARALPNGMHGTAPLIHHEIGIDPSYIRGAPAEVRGAGEPLRALFVGRLLGWKGVHLAIRALARVRAENCDVTLTVVGTGPLEASLKKLAGRLGVSEAITWVGHIPQRDVIELYRGYHCFLFPSLHDSGGTVVLEAMAAALPVICLDRGGPAVLVSADCAAVVATSSATEDQVVDRIAVALTELATDENRRIAMSRAAIARVVGMSWERRVRAAVDIVEGRLEDFARCASCRGA
jgi:glycosyltransferase involved in cell wall biosynthesis